MDEGMHEGCSSSAGNKKYYKPEMAHCILDIVAEDPDEQHVSGQMHEIPMQEGVGDIMRVSGQDIVGGRQALIAIGDGWNEAVGINSGAVKILTGKQTGSKHDP